MVERTPDGLRLNPDESTRLVSELTKQAKLKGPRVDVVGAIVGLTLTVPGKGSATMQEWHQALKEKLLTTDPDYTADKAKADILLARVSLKRRGIDVVNLAGSNNRHVGGLYKFTDDVIERLLEGKGFDEAEIKAKNVKSEKEDQPGSQLSVRPAQRTRPTVARLSIQDEVSVQASDVDRVRVAEAPHEESKDAHWSDRHQAAIVALVALQYLERNRELIVRFIPPHDISAFTTLAEELVETLPGLIYPGKRQDFAYKPVRLRAISRLPQQMTAMLAIKDPSSVEQRLYKWLGQHNQSGQLGGFLRVSNIQDLDAEMDLAVKVSDRIRRKRERQSKKQANNAVSTETGKNLVLTDVLERPEVAGEEGLFIMDEQVAVCSITAQRLVNSKNIALASTRLFKRPEAQAYLAALTSDSYLEARGTFLGRLVRVLGSEFDEAIDLYDGDLRLALEDLRVNNAKGEIFDKILLLLSEKPELTLKIENGIRAKQQEAVAADVLKIAEQDLVTLREQFKDTLAQMEKVGFDDIRRVVVLRMFSISNGQMDAMLNILIEFDEAAKARLRNGEKPYDAYKFSLWEIMALRYFAKNPDFQARSVDEQRTILDQIKSIASEYSKK